MYPYSLSWYYENKELKDNFAFLVKYSITHTQNIRVLYYSLEICNGFDLYIIPFSVLYRIMASSKKFFMEDEGLSELEK